MNLNLKHRKNGLLFCLLKLVLFFNVFAFSGFSEPTQPAFLNAFPTELVEIKSNRFAFPIKNFLKDINAFGINYAYLALHSSQSWALFHYNRIVLIKYKSFTKKSLHFNIPFLHIALKIPFPSKTSKNHPSPFNFYFS